MDPPVLLEDKRIVPPLGANIAGRSVPGGTLVTVSRYAAHMSNRNWTEPQKFLPERWTDCGLFPSDRKDTSQPFGAGARICLGMR